MTQAIHKQANILPISLNPILSEILVLVFILLTSYLCISLYSYTPADPGFSQLKSDVEIYNSGGKIGAFIADVVLYILGYPGYILPLVLLSSCGILFYNQHHQKPLDYYQCGYHIGGILLIFLGCCNLSWLHYAANSWLPSTIKGGGGILGFVIGQWLETDLGYLGATLTSLVILLAGISLYTGLSWLWIIDTVGKYTLIGWSRVLHFASQFIGQQTEIVVARRARKERVQHIQKEKEVVEERPPVHIEPIISDFLPSERVIKEKQEPLFEDIENNTIPPIKLLDEPPEAKNHYSKEALEALSRKVELKLKDFGIEVEVMAVHPGPVVTRFELALSAGLKVSKISSLDTDLARSLAVSSVRVVEIIPGKPHVGLEIPNEHREIVILSEILSSNVYEDSKSPLTIALGKDINGAPVVTDLLKMTHVLVAGTTGSGKSVALNAFILSLLYKSTSKEVRIIMIDPKMLELSIYEGIPHLLTPVVTDMKEARNALNWCVAEMERRYKLMAGLGVRNLSGYNRKVQSIQGGGDCSIDEILKLDDHIQHNELEELPMIVIIIDELADMMMTVGKKVEELIARLAQKARASGIHLIIATQRPSVDVITGLIKANIPSRIAFQVSSKIDSRTILDQKGAESLLGHGDMLFLPIGSSIPNRIHGAFVSDEEVHKVVKHIKDNNQPDYNSSILSYDTDASDQNHSADGNEEADPLYEQAVQIVMETQRASISYIQRRLKVGYNRAARMIEDMENHGLVGTVNNSGNREVLVTQPEV